MFKIGDKVKLNIIDLEEHGWADLEPWGNASNKDYKKYILQEVDRIYTIISIDKNDRLYPYRLGDEFMKDTFFAPEELIKL